MIRFFPPSPPPLPQVLLHALILSIQKFPEKFIYTHTKDGRNEFIQEIVIFITITTYLLLLYKAIWQLIDGFRVYLLYLSLSLSSNKYLLLLCVLVYAISNKNCCCPVIKGESCHCKTLWLNIIRL